MHEGDWEMVQVVLNSDGTPIKAMYSQHVSGQKAAWSEVEKDGEVTKTAIFKHLGFVEV